METQRNIKGGFKMHIAARLREFNTIDFVCSYFFKFCLGLGIGLLLPKRWSSWGGPILLLGILIGFRAESKFWKSHN